MDDGSATPRRAGGAIVLVSQATTGNGRPRYAVQDPPGRQYELLDRFSQAKYRAGSFDEMAAKADRLRTARFTAIDGDGTRTEVRQSEGRWPVPAPPRWMQFPQGPGTIELAGSRPGTAAEQAQAQAQASESARLRAGLHAEFEIQRNVRSVGSVGGRPDSQASETTYQPHDHVASFTESGKRIETDSGRHDVIRAMVEVAQIRGWTVQRVEGSEDFKRQVWLESSARNIKTHGYDPKPWDLEMLRQARAERGLVDAAPGPAAAPERPSLPGAVSQRAVLAAVESVLAERQMPPAERRAVLKATAERLVQRDAALRFELKPVERTASAPAPALQPSRVGPEPGR